MTRTAVNGIELNVEMTGDGSPVLLLHGLTGSAATWRPFSDPWDGFRLVAVDLIGHGDSDHPADPERYRMDRAVEDLSALLDALKIESAAVLGYSMGGRVALHLALNAPRRVRALVLESASPGIEDGAGREARVRSDEELARGVERDGIEPFVDRWEALPLFATQALLAPEVRAGLRRQRLANDPGGLANSLRGMGAGAQKPLFDRLGEIASPTLLLAGALDEKYRSLGERQARAMPRARLELIPEAGHTTHLERPEAFAQAVRGFLRETMQGERGKEEAPCR